MTTKLVQLVAMTPERIATLQMLCAATDNNLYFYMRLGMEVEIIKALEVWQQVLIEVEADPDKEETK